MLNKIKENCEKFAGNNAFCINDQYYSYHDFARRITTIQDEINLILLNKLDTQQNLNRDIITNNLTEPVYYGTILIRQPTPDIEKFNIQLWNEFKYGYKRDQILIPIFIKNVNYNVVDDISIWNKNPYLNWTKNHLVKRTQF